jgi:hypothetical protein
MTAAKQTQHVGIAELAQSISTGGVQPLQHQSFAIVEAQRDVDRFHDLRVHQAADECGALRRPFMQMTEHALDAPQSHAWL